jgi:NAD(P)-dependent dehydrogenase (short-subunit alcohol dehydrogenase family)
MTDLSGKVAVITGAGDGIGRALAGALAAEAARLVLADLDAEKLAAAGAELTRGGAEVLTVRTDVSCDADVLALRDAAVARFGTVHVLCNNAGVMGPAGDPLWELPVGEWERVLAVNFFGVLHGVQAFLPVMLANGEAGHVLNTASMQGLAAGSLIPEYTVSKYAVVALSEALHAQLRERDVPIGVTVLCPSAVSTDLASRERRRLSGLAGGSPWAVPPGGGGPPAQWGHVLTPDQAAATALAAVRADRLYAFTHPDSRVRVEARFGPILDALAVVEQNGPARSQS